MKNLVSILILAALVAAASCKKDTQSETFKLLTGPVWVSDSLLANGIDASGPLGMLKNFIGEAKFKEDGTGKFGVYTGKWRFAFNETKIVIETDSLPVPLTTDIAELTKTSLKVTTRYPSPLDPLIQVDIRMTFKAE